MVEIPSVFDSSRFDIPLDRASRIARSFFDRLLIEQLPVEKITFAVRGRPVINDATLVDAEATGVTQVVDVIDNGSDAPGTLIDECSEKFKQHLADADLVIAKGQGNYESLSDLDKNIYFIFKVKCRVVANHTGLAPGSLAIKKNAALRD